MVTKSHQGNQSPVLSEKKKKLKKKKKKKAVKQPETGLSVVHSDTYFLPQRPTSPTKRSMRGKSPEVLMKKKKKKKDHSTLSEEAVGLEPVFQGQRRAKSPRRARSPTPTKSPSPRHREFPSAEKKKKRKSLWPPDSRPKSSLSPKKGEEVPRAGEKLKYKKEKKTKQPKDPWPCKVGEDIYPYLLGQCSEDQTALGHKRKQGSPQEYSTKMKKKKKIQQEGDGPLGRPGLSRSLESSPRKGSKKKLVKGDPPEYIPIGDGSGTPTKKKMKLKEKAELPGGTSLKRKKKKTKKDSTATEETEEEEDPNTDLEVVLEKKGNVDEVHIDQVRRRALQEEIDRESGKTETTDTSKWTGTHFGQWDTAEFEDEEKKLKFLKLMGGFKNLSPSFRRPPQPIDKSNMALGRKASESLQQQLMRDYDRAMSWKYNRGSGLGFSSIPNKVFYIDKNASKSIRFED